MIWTFGHFFTSSVPKKGGLHFLGFVYAENDLTL